MTAACCVCHPVMCAEDETGDHCISRSCPYCLHGCPAGENPCCLDAKPTGGTRIVDHT